ncbi:MAG: biosynthetic-type acetolactate synthase large subunit [Limnochordia bacterium]|jgi:acetolactate synthase-1/2/3 large subunit
MRMTGAQAIIAALEKEGVDVVFGYPGGAVLPLYDALYDANIRHILTRHEQGAAHAADGYARTTGKPGVCISTSGPGATNLVTGLANAYMDSVPVVAITGQVATSLIGRDSFQEADITGITMPITKHNFLLKRVEDIPQVFKEAFHIATTGRPGPVLIDIPKDLTTAEFDFVYPEEVDLPGYKPVYEGNARQIKLAAEAIATAQKPVLYVGGGVNSSGAAEELYQLATKCQIPVTTTLMGLGAFPGDHELFLGMLGMHGTAYANYAVTKSDLLIAVGARFDDRVTGTIKEFAPQAQIIHIDIDPAEIGKNVLVDIPIVGNLGNVLGKLLQEVQPTEHGDWLAEIEGWKKTHPLCYESCNGTVKPQWVVEEISRLTQGEAIITTEVGQHQMWTAQYYRFTKPRSFVTSGGLGTMGFGFPAAIGAQLGNPDKTVITIAGDGSIQMNIQELGTMAAYKLPIKLVILNNGFLGMVRQWQELFFDRRYSQVTLDHNPDFIKLAEAYGVKGIRVTKPNELHKALQDALDHDGPVVLDVRVTGEENVFPMVPAGGAIHQMLGLEGQG